MDALINWVRGMLRGEAWAAVKEWRGRSRYGDPCHIIGWQHPDGRRRLEVVQAAKRFDGETWETIAGQDANAWRRGLGDGAQGPAKLYAISGGKPAA